MQEVCLTSLEHESWARRTDITVIRGGATFAFEFNAECSAEAEGA